MLVFCFDAFSLREPGGTSLENALDAGANRPQQKRRKVRMIGGLGIGLALGAPRFGPADGGDARGRRGGRRHERVGGGGLRLRVSPATAPGMPFLTRLGIARLGVPVFTRLGMP